MICDDKTEEILRFTLADCAFFSDIYSYDTVTSTNDICKELAASGAKEGSLVIAKSQTAGRGRLGRRFHSPLNNGLYMSLLLRPQGESFAPGLLTACGAVAVHQAICKLYHVALDIKWVNDLYFDGKKLCGILAEGQFDSQGKPLYVIMGIGVNLYPPQEGYAEDIRQIATSLFDACPECTIDRNELCAEIVRQFANIYKGLPNRDFLQIYRKHAFVLDKKVRYEKQGKTMNGTAVSIDDEARLIVRDDDGNDITLDSGEITLLRPVL
ncbi:MAG: biotin--[Clostridia bacterium]|nr:biotin--[acetyl-CoA-carboxylase] ligase [Clostridia bacterium]